MFRTLVSACMATFSGTVNHGLWRVVLLYSLFRGWTAAFANVKTALLQVDAKDPLLLQLPDQLPPSADKLGFEPGEVYVQKKAVYGTIERRGSSLRASKAA